MLNEEVLMTMDEQAVDRCLNHMLHSLDTSQTKPHEQLAATATLLKIMCDRTEIKPERVLEAIHNMLYSRVLIPGAKTIHHYITTNWPVKLPEPLLVKPDVTTRTYTPTEYRW